MPPDEPGGGSSTAKARWNESYVLTRNKNLWGDPPVPFVADAIATFQADGATTVLDLPCGDGRNLPPLARAFTSVHGADCATNALAIAADRLRASGLTNVTLGEADILATGFGDDTFDGVFCCDVLGHLVDPARAIHELLRVCKPERSVVMNLFATGDSTRGLDMQPIGDEAYTYHGMYYRFYDRHSVDLLLRQVEVKPISVNLVHWTEPPHEGYREYDHDHESWLVVVRKPAVSAAPGDE